MQPIIRIFIFFCLLSAGLIPASAQAADPVPGDACTVAGASVQSGGPELSGAGHILVCSGGIWVSAVSYTATGRTDIQINNDTGSCTSAKTGRMRYSSATNIWEYCSGTAWGAFAQGGGPVCDVFDHDPGYVCPDGSSFAGFTHDTYVPFFVTRCDAGQTWSGSACTGSTTPKPWNNGNTSGYVSAVTSLTDGKANTIALSTGGTYQDSNSGVAGIQPHQAAQHCSDLVENGHSDWYLPSISELYAMYVTRLAVGNYSPAFFWSSTQGDSSSTGTFMNYTTGGEIGNTATKNNSVTFRCARRN